MSQRNKTRSEIAHSAYLSISDIRKLFQVSYAVAKRIHTFANEIDDEELNKWRTEPTKVRINSVCRVQGITLAQIQKLAESK